jgi:hypothetical protein
MKNVMEVARVYVKFNKLGSGVFKTVTPAEYVILARAHEVNAGGKPISQQQIIGTIDRSGEIERQRLHDDYPNLKHLASGAKEIDNSVKICWPEGTEIPMTFKEIAERVGDKDLLKLPREAFKRQDYVPKPTSQVVIRDDKIKPIGEDSAEEPTEEIVSV